MTRYPLYRRLGGLQGRGGRVRRISPPPHRDSIPEPSSPQRVAIPTDLSRPTISTKAVIHCAVAHGWTQHRDEMADYSLLYDVCISKNWREVKRGTKEQFHYDWYVLQVAPRVTLLPKWQRNTRKSPRTRRQQETARLWNQTCQTRSTRCREQRSRGGTACVNRSARLDATNFPLFRLDDPMGKERKERTKSLPLHWRTQWQLTTKNRQKKFAL